MSSFGQQLFQGCLYKSMADRCREMLAKRQKSGSMTATADDAESAADGLTPICKERRSSPVVSAHRHRRWRWQDHLPTGLHCVVAGGHGGISALPACRWTFCRHQASCTSCTCHPQQPGDGGPDPVSTYMWCQILDIFDVQGGVDLYANQLVRKYIRYVNFT